MKKLEEKLKPFGSKPGLSRIRKLLTKWGNPQNKFKVILVSGTNGKGSTVSYLSSILKQAGLKVGSFYSPHLVNYTERIRINGKEISDKEFRKYEDRIVDYFEKGNKITYFEAITAIAFQYFSDKKVEYAVMEIGMGGRLDACNIADEEIAVVTNIGKEHTRWLGKKQEEIAYEKIGVLKKGIGITGAKGSALGRIKKEAGKRGRKLFSLNKDFFVSNIIASSTRTIFNYKGERNYKKLELKMLGDCQAENASLAIRASEELKIQEKYVRKGLKKAKIRGRMDLINQNPKILVDVAHNPEGMKQLVKNLEIFEYDRLILIFGVMKDKNWKKMIKLLDKRADEIILVKPKHNRAEDPNKIKRYLGRGKVILESKNAIDYTRKTIRKKDLVLITGSIYFIGEILAIGF